MTNTENTADRNAEEKNAVSMVDIENQASDEIIDLGQLGIKPEKTLAFLVDPEASPLQVRATAAHLINVYEVERVIVDLTSAAGIAVAQAADSADIPFESLDYSQEIRFEDDLLAEHNRLSVACDGVRYTQLGSIAGIDANIVLLPTTQGEDEQLISLGFDSLPGIALQQLQKTGTPCLIILPPETGLVTEGSPADPSRIYMRKLLHVSG